LARMFGVAAILAVTLWVNRMVYGGLEWYKQNVVEKTESTLDDELFPLISKSAGIAIWTVAMLIVLAKMGLNINALITTLGVGSLAVALAAQDTIANIISGFLLMIDRPFRIGDEISLPSGERVKVLDIGVRRSKFAAENGSCIIVPNVDLSKSKIVNFSYGSKTAAK
ncbi:MAG: mechanosensitive ion channel domain-containing protein, partial [Candidatus Omnitrophota bacterium]